MKQNRILVKVLFLVTAFVLSAYAQLPISNNMPASGVLGTSDFVTNTNYAPASDTTLSGPKGIAIDPTTGKLFVADYENRRVLRWSSADKMINGSAAEAVLGQPDFTTTNSGTSATEMSRPYDVYIDAAGRLWVADMTNARVLMFNNASSIPSGSPANKVLGQLDFATGTINTGGISASTMNRPISVFGDAAGNLYVSDRDNRRVLRFNNAASKDNGDPADGVLGQPDFVTTTAGLDASTLGDRAWGIFVDVSGNLWVCDRDNHRVLRFDNAVSKANGAAADVVLGQADFVSNATALTASGLTDPKGVFMDAMGRLFVADEGNNRIKVYNNAASISFLADADYVLGQPDMVTGGWPPVDPPTASSLNYAEYLYIDNTSNHIWVADEYNHRILRFDALVVPVELVSFTANVIFNRVELNWSTASEKNNAGFDIEKNNNGTWNKIGFVKGSGTTSEKRSYSFSENTSAGKYQYRLKQIDLNGKFEYSNIVDVTVGLTPEDYKLSQNFPNPFNPSTTITFAMKNTENVTVTVHNIIGEKVATLFNGVANANEVYRITFDAKNLSSGIYFYQLNSASRNEVKKMNLLR